MLKLSNTVVIETEANWSQTTDNTWYAFLDLLGHQARIISRLVKSHNPLFHQWSRSWGQEQLLPQCSNGTLKFWQEVRPLSSDHMAVVYLLCRLWWESHVEVEIRSTSVVTATTQDFAFLTQFHKQQVLHRLCIGTAIQMLRLCLSTLARMCCMCWSRKVRSVLIC